MYNCIQIKALIILLCTSSTAELCAAPEGERGSKSDYTWSNPVPAELLRDMTTDRPDATESPFTVDTGHAQVEMDFANYGQDSEKGTETTESEVLPFNLRFGVSENFELGLFLVPHHRTEEVLPSGTRTVVSGMGDITLRAKWNRAGNDGGDFGWGLMADIKLPTAAAGLSNGYFEGALTLPTAFALEGGWGGGAMTSLGWVYDDNDDVRVVWLNTFTVGHALTDTIGGFVELVSEVGNGRHVATFNTGLTLSLDSEMQLDCGVNFALSDAAQDLSYFVGITRRY